MNVKEKDDTKLVMIVFGIIILILFLTMINNFKFVDCAYFCVVLFFAVKYLILSRK